MGAKDQIELKSELVSASILTTPIETVVTFPGSISKLSAEVWGNSFFGLTLATNPLKSSKSTHDRM